MLSPIGRRQAGRGTTADNGKQLGQPQRRPFPSSFSEDATLGQTCRQTGEERGACEPGRCAPQGRRNSLAVPCWPHENDILDFVLLLRQKEVLLSLELLIFFSFSQSTVFTAVLPSSRGTRLHPGAWAGYPRTGERAPLCTPLCLPGAERLCAPRWRGRPSFHQSHFQFVLTVFLIVSGRKRM